MLTLYSYPPLFGVADNNGYGLKVFTFLKLTGVAFEQRHTVDASSAPRQQLPYIVDDGKEIGDSDSILSYLERRYALTIDAGLDQRQRDTVLMVSRLLDDLYWVMSYARWKDPSFWPVFHQALRREHPEITEEQLEKAREFNAQRYHYQGIGRFAPAEAYARGLADLDVLARLVPAYGFVFGPAPTSIDAAVYGFIANIYFYAIETPLKVFVASHGNLVSHCLAIHNRIAPKADLPRGPEEG
jgi:glutathione S-transferase